jgi:hypothetical protein
MQHVQDTGSHSLFAHTIALFPPEQIVNCTVVLSVTSSLSLGEMNIDCLRSVVMLFCCSWTPSVF